VPRKRFEVFETSNAPLEIGVALASDLSSGYLRGRMLVNEEDARFYVADSTVPGAGKGLFTRVPIQRGERLEVVGVMVRRDSASDRASHFSDHHKFRVGEDLLLIPLGFGAMVNHSSTPNLKKVFEDDCLYLEALRDLPANEEVFFTYTPYAQQAFGLV
jgi:uncharacterized protein